MARLLVVQHEPDAPGGWLGEWWTELGLELDVVRGDLGEPVAAEWACRPRRPRGARRGDGGLRRRGRPWLAPTRALLADAVGRGGAHARRLPGSPAGGGGPRGTVSRNPSGRTSGPVPVRLNAAGGIRPAPGRLRRARGDPLQRRRRDRLPTVRRCSRRCPTGGRRRCRFGPRAWGVQFHPETSPEMFASWMTSFRPQGEELVDGPQQWLGAMESRRARFAPPGMPSAEAFARA